MEIRQLMYNFDVKELSSADMSLWDALVDQSPHGTLFHKSGWLTACARSLGQKIRIFGCYHDGVLVGGCSLFIDRKKGFVPVASSTCTLTPYGGVILSIAPSTSVHKRETWYRQIIFSLIDYIESERFFLISIRNSPDFPDIRPFTLNGWKSTVFYAYYIDLTNNFESKYDSSLKRNIRKAEKNHLIFEPFSDISRYYALFCDTYTRKNKKPPVPKHLFTELYSFIRDQNCGEMVVAKTTDDEIACVEIVIWDGKQAFSWSAASDFRFLTSGASSFIMNEYMKRLKDRGIPKINIMMANIPELSSMATSFNPTLRPYYEVKSTIFNNLLSGRR